MDDDIPVAPRLFERSYPLEDIAIRAGGDGRTVVAYAAVFDTQAEIRDFDGHYMETITRTAFDKTIAERAGRVRVFYNHGKTLYGTPSERFSVPLGTPEEIRADDKGLLTVTRYNRNPLADEILEAIRNGDITSQSFSGKIIRSKRTRNHGTLDTIVRTEMGLSEYGPTPIPSYDTASIVGVRMNELADTLAHLGDQERSELLELLGTSRNIETPPPTVDAAPGTSTDDDTPAAGHLSGPTPAERRHRLLVLRGITQ
jgi:HK97 family phage prohead protease